MIGICPVIIGRANEQDNKQKMGRLSGSANSLKMLFYPTLHAPGEKVDIFCKAFSEQLLGDSAIECFMAYRARILFWAMIKTMGLTETDEVILPAYTCEAVPMAVRFAGAKCVYVDCAKDDWNPDTEALLRAVTSKTRLVLLQHTYGIVRQAKVLREKLPDHVEILEDACQVVEHERLSANRPYTLGALFSLQWNKPITTGLGGLLAVHNPLFAEHLKSFIAGNFDKRKAASQVRRLILQMLAYQTILTPATRPVLSRIYRFMQENGLLRGTTTPEEYGEQLPMDYSLTGTDVQAIWGLDAINEWPGTLMKRRELTRQYLDYFAKHNGPLPRGANGRDALWAVPVKINDKTNFIAGADKRKLAFGYWFGRMPVHLSPQTASKYGYQIGSSPRAEKMIMQEIFLSTNPELSMKQAFTAAAYLLNHGQILS